MRKKYKGSVCVYCTAASNTRDHLFARQFFQVQRRDNLPAVPACTACNRRKSELEHYLASVVPFGGQHVDAQATLENDVPGRLAKNLRLHRELADGASRVAVEAKPGDWQGTIAVPFQWGTLVEYLNLVVRGLVSHHFQTVLPTDARIDVVLVNAENEAATMQLVRRFQGRTVEADWGAGTFAYRGVQSSEHPHLTVWEMKIFGGLKFADGAEEVSRIIVWTLPAERAAAA